MLSKVIQVIDSIAEGIVVRTDRGVRAVVKHGEVTIGTIIDEFGKIHGQPAKQVAPKLGAAGARAGDITAPLPPIDPGTITVTEQPIAEPGVPLVDAPPAPPAPQPQGKDAVPEPSTTKVG